MKTLYLIRHAKSSWNTEGLDDIDRHLSYRGYSDAHEMAKRLKNSIRESFIVSSPAVRALTTALIFSRHLDHDPSRIHIAKELYESDVNAYCNVIAGLPEEKHCILLFGHNPVITATANFFGGTELGDLPTCGIAGISFEEPAWKKISGSRGKLVLFDFPKNKINGK
ncbi:MAG: histidine phosphatase family protein [Bacteroidetes bacterium]|nr:histidine phosphatase family protein [Bacteroidota bacterium]